MKIYTIVLPLTLVISLTGGIPISSPDNDEDFNPAHLKPAVEGDDRPLYSDDKNPEETSEITNEGAPVDILRPKAIPEDSDEDIDYPMDSEEFTSDEINSSEEDYQKIHRKKRSPESEEKPVEVTTEDTIVIEACEPLRSACLETGDQRSNPCSAFREKCTTDQGDEAVFNDPFDCFQSGNCQEVVGAEKK